MASTSIEKAIARGMMSTIDAIAAARKRYLDSPRTRRDWIIYVQTVETLRMQREGVEDPNPLA
jgi:hypothetical protein